MSEVVVATSILRTEIDPVAISLFSSGDARIALRLAGRIDLVRTLTTVQQAGGDTSRAWRHRRHNEAGGTISNWPVSAALDHAIDEAGATALERFRPQLILKIEALRASHRPHRRAWVRSHRDFHAFAIAWLPARGPVTDTCAAGRRANPASLARANADGVFASISKLANLLVRGGARPLAVSPSYLLRRNVLRADYDRQDGEKRPENPFRARDTTNSVRST